MRAGQPGIRHARPAELPALARWSASLALAARPPRLPPPRVDRRAAGRAFSPEVLARSVCLVAEGGRGEPVAGAVAAEVPHPLDGVAEGYLHTFCLRAGAGPRTGAALLEAVARESAARGWRFLRSTAAFEDAAAAAGGGFEVAAVEVHRDLRGPAGRPPRSDLHVDVAGSGDRDFVAGLVAAATRLGLRPAERVLVGGGCVERWAGELVDRVLAGGGIVLIGRDGGRRVGHALCEVDALDGFTGVREPLLHDACAVDGARGKGVSATLTVAVEAALRARGEAALTGVVSAGDGGDVGAVLASLAALGWRPGRARLLRTLAPPAG